jgi:protein-S-isoprenylcysteine O-methyltransferase Ste14
VPVIRKCYHETMKNLNIKAFGGLLGLLVVMGAGLFLSAWTFEYWQAWVFLAVFGTSTLFVTLYLMKHDPALLERRVEAGPGAEKEWSQKVIQSIAQIAFIAVIILPAFDYRFSWSVVPTYAVITGDVLVALGLYFVFLVFKENTFTSATIEIADSQKVISTGPYALVRHPMYAGAFVMLLGVSPALGSWWGLVAVIQLMLAIVVRLFDEEKFLVKNLPGYAEYQKKVKFKLVPFIW